MHKSIPVLTLLALSGTAHAGVVQIDAQGPVIEVTAAQTVESTPDEATVGAGVTTRARTAVASMQDNAAKMSAVVARIKALGIAAQDIQTSGVNLNPSYQYNNNAAPTFLGYDVTNTVSVRVRDVARIGPILDALVTAGATNISGPVFRRDDDSAPREEARKLAFQAAEAQARSLARIAGWSGIKLLEVDEGYSQQPAEIMVTAKRMVAQAASTPVEPGRVGTQVQLTVKYEMTR